MIDTELSRPIGWRGKLYGPGPASIPDDLARALGLSTPEPTQAQEQPPTPEPEPDPQSIAASPALALINSSDRARDLTPIPTIGAKAAAIVMEHRPVNGYPSLDDLPADIFEPPFNCDRAQIEAWEG